MIHRPPMPDTGKRPSPTARRWLEGQATHSTAFPISPEEAAGAQERKLLAYLHRNAHTAYGAASGFARIRRYEDYAAEVAIIGYAELQPWVQRVAAGEKGVLTDDGVIALEETSGSGGARKWIPYTRGLLREFESAVGVWMRDLADTTPAAFAGTFYWSVSPPLAGRGRSPGGIPIGLDSDLAYFSTKSAALLAELMVAPPELGRSTCAGAWFAATTDSLLSHRDLSMVSVWSPTFFLSLDRHLQARLGSRQFVWSEIWPGLALMSCWTDAGSAAWIPEVRERLGEVAIQGKGLLSTEGVVSIPLGDIETPPTLATASHFLEFRDPHSGEVSLCHELRAGQIYEVVLTSAGGLYRYATGDLVRSYGDLKIRFVGRAGQCSDLVGEKLDEQQATAALSGLDGALWIAPCDDGYTLYLDAQTGDPDAGRMRTAVEDRLMENRYYRQAVDLGQLRPLDTRPVNAAQIDALLLALSKRSGGRLADMKIPALFTSKSSQTCLASVFA